MFPSSSTRPLSRSYFCTDHRQTNQPISTLSLIAKVGSISSNAQADNWQAQDKGYRRLYAEVSHEEFLEASPGPAAGSKGKSTTRKETNSKHPTQLLSPQILDPHLGLLDVLENHSLFTYQVRLVGVRCG